MKEELVRICSPFISPEGLTVVTQPDTGDVLVFFAGGDVKQYAGGKYTDWENLSEDAQLFWYGHVVDNEQLLEHYLRENVIEFDAEFLEKGNAREIAGKDGTIIGHLVDVATEEGDQTVNSIIFHSPDGTFATLSAWIVGETGSREMAGEDLKIIAQELLKYHTENFEDEKTLE